jgi:hypothetical protein
MLIYVHYFLTRQIPLAKKLKECHVFGVSSDEFLTYAMDNRMEWESKGEAIVAELVQLMESLSHTDTLRSSSPECRLEI